MGLREVPAEVGAANVFAVEAQHRAARRRLITHGGDFSEYDRATEWLTRHPEFCSTDGPSIEATVALVRMKRSVPTVTADELAHALWFNWEAMVRRGRMTEADVRAVLAAQLPNLRRPEGWVD